MPWEKSLNVPFFIEIFIHATHNEKKRIIFKDKEKNENVKVH